MKYAIVAMSVTVAGLTSEFSYAQESNLRGETFCFPAKGVPKLVNGLATLKPKYRNIVDVRLQPRFIVKDQGVWPDRFYLAKNGETITELPFSRETGAVPDFLEATQTRPDTDICIDDPTRADRPKDDEGLYFEMGLSPLFKSATGTHSLVELKEGSKDGKKFYKKMLPNAIAFLMPKTNYLAIKMVDRSKVPMAFVSTAEGERELALETFKDMWIVRLDDIEAVAGEALIIRGGAYDLQPVPSPKILRRFGWGAATNDE